MVAAMRVDFHLHTTASDGRMTPEQLLVEVVRGRLRYWAVTDHDTCAGYRSLVGHPGLIPGVEVSCWFEGREIHVVGLGIDPDDVAFAAFLEQVRQGRRRRLRGIIDHVNGIAPGALDPAMLETDADRVLTRWHLAGALASRGLVAHPGEAYTRLIGDDVLVELPTPDLPAPATTAAAIAAAGGVSILAHPAQMADINLIHRLMAQGLVGIERCHPRLPRGLRRLIEAAARTHGWLGSCGSDAHLLPIGRRLGDWHLPAVELQPLLERLARWL